MVGSAKLTAGSRHTYISVHPKRRRDWIRPNLHRNIPCQDLQGTYRACEKYVLSSFKMPMCQRIASMRMIRVLHGFAFVSIGRDYRHDISVTRKNKATRERTKARLKLAVIATTKYHVHEYTRKTRNNTDIHSHVHVHTMHEGSFDRRRPDDLNILFLCRKKEKKMMKKMDQTMTHACLCLLLAVKPGPKGRMD